MSKSDDVESNVFSPLFSLPSGGPPLLRTHSYLVDGYKDRIYKKAIQDVRNICRNSRVSLTLTNDVVTFVSIICSRGPFDREGILNEMRRQKFINGFIATRLARYDRGVDLVSMFADYLAAEVAPLAELSDASEQQPLASPRPMR